MWFCHSGKCTSWNIHADVCHQSADPDPSVCHVPIKNPDRTRFLKESCNLWSIWNLLPSLFYRYLLAKVKIPCDYPKKYLLTLIFTNNYWRGIKLVSDLGFCWIHVQSFLGFQTRIRAFLIQIFNSELSNPLHFLGRKTKKILFVHQDNRSTR